MEITRVDCKKRYSEAVIHNNTVYLSGQVPWKSEDADFVIQAEEVFDLGYKDFVVMGLSGSIESVHYQSVFSSMVKVVQDLNKRVEELEAKISGSI